MLKLTTYFKRRSVFDGEKERKKKKEKSRDVFLPLCSNKVVSIIQKGKEKNSTAVCGNLSARWRKQMVMRRQWTKQKRTVTVLLRSTPNMRMHRQDHLPSPPSACNEADRHSQLDKSYSDSVRRSP